MSNVVRMDAYRERRAREGVREEEKPPDVDGDEDDGEIRIRIRRGGPYRARIDGLFAEDSDLVIEALADLAKQVVLAKRRVGV
ncbi:hypothetical protein BKK79_00795 [Cupriavidus sp. USMAA2-4]|uniref:hypothetical protein n=1 Tax=Cupriavidus sp. USMAA2-4 TaxID=876364 RepID=UPI0008A6BAAD|nr:hypothetical protein [Cupriavidus sp. USMAA2-4]AOY90526.1 hypothetical protein BKK79_00795 [Cupriavidus sp. USMAA2-4]